MGDKSQGLKESLKSGLYFSCLTAVGKNRLGWLPFPPRLKRQLNPSPVMRGPPALAALEECLHLIKLLKWQAVDWTGKGRWAATRPSPFCLPLPDSRGATQPTIHSFSTKGRRGEGDVVNGYRAGSFTFFCKLPKRLAEKASGVQQSPLWHLISPT